MRRRILSLALLMQLGFALVARGQLVEDYRFKGQTVDQSGSPIPKVQVTFRNVVSGARIQFASDDKGTFDRRMIPHAVYEATFEKPGYVTTKEKFDWSASAPDTITKEAQVVLQSEAELAKKDLGKKVGTLYQDAYAALAAGDCAKATKAADELLVIGAGAYEHAVRFVLARCHAIQNELEAAAAEYQKVIGLKPELYEAHFDLANVNEMRKDHDAALLEFHKASELKPDDAEAHYQMGAILFNLHKYDLAIPHLDRTLALNPSHAAAAKALGFAHLQGEKKDYEAAVTMLKRYLELAPEAADKAQVGEIVKSFESSKAAAASPGAKPGTAPRAGTKK